MEGCKFRRVRGVGVRKNFDTVVQDIVKFIHFKILRNYSDRKRSITVEVKFLNVDYHCKAIF